MANRLAVDNIINDNLNQGVQFALTLVVCDDSLFWTLEGKSLTLSTWTDLGNVVQTKYHIL